MIPEKVQENILDLVERYGVLSVLFGVAACDQRQERALELDAQLHETKEKIKLLMKSTSLP